MVRFVAAALLLLAAPAAATGTTASRYLGTHPVSARAGGGYCYIEAPHLHDYAPDHAVLYHRGASGWIFTGDPTPFGYDGERHVFYGHHPVPGDGAAPLYCLIDGPHAHAYAARGDDYQIVDGVAFYMGELLAAYANQRAASWQAVNAEMLPFARQRPLVHVHPPIGWQGREWVPPWIEVKVSPLVRRKPDRRTRVRVDVR